MIEMNFGIVIDWSLEKGTDFFRDKLLDERVDES